MPITRATNLAGLGTVFDALTEGGGLSVSGVSTFTDLNSTRINVTGVSTFTTEVDFTNGPVLIGTGTSTGTVSQRLQVTGGAYISENIGIGTTKPVEKLHISNNSATGPSIYITNNSTGHTSSDGVQIGFDASNDVEIRNRENTRLRFYTSNIERLQILSNGQVGIGTSSTLRGSLDITESSQWSSANYGASLVIGGGRNNAIGLLDSTSAFPWAIANTGGSLSFSTMPLLGITTLPPNVRMQIDSNGNVLIGGGGGVLANGTASQPLQVTGGAYISGSVGIGITNPVGLAIGSTQTLHLNGVDAVLRVGPYYSTGGDRDNILLVADDTDTYIRSNNERFHIYNSNGDVVVHAGAGDTERARIYSNGYLELKTINPQLNSDFYAINVLSALTLTSDLSTNNGADARPQISFRAPYAANNADRVTYAAVCGFKQDTGQGGRLGVLQFLTNDASNTTPTELKERARFNGAGELLIGYTSDNGAYLLQVNSQIFATSSTIATSDGRYKENVSDLENCTEIIKKLRPVSFTWKEQTNVVGYNTDGSFVEREGHNFPKGYQVGFIAQEVQETLSGKSWVGSIVKENVRKPILNAYDEEIIPEEKFYGIAEGNMIAVLTSALKESISEIEILKNKVSNLESQIVGIAST